MTLVDALGWTLIHFLWQGAAIALVLALANVVLSRATARVRHAAACAALASMLASVAVTFAVLRAAPSDGTFVGGVLATSSTLASTSAGQALGQLPTTPSMGNPLPFLVYAWLAGVCLLSVRSAGGWAMAVRLTRRRTQPVDPQWQERFARLTARLSIARPVRLCESALADAPMVIGWLRPVVLLPAAAVTGLPPAQLEALLAHELAHVRRHDYLINVVQTAVETMLFYHPAVWWVGRRIRIEREHSCDDLAVEVCGDAVMYARALARLEELRQELPHFAMAASRGSLTERVQHVIRRGDQPELHAGRVVTAVLLGAIAVFATAYTSLTAGQEQELPRQEQSATPPVETTPAETSSQDAASQGRPTRERVTQMFVGLLDDPDVSIRLQAVQSLGQMEDPAAVPGLSEALVDDDDAGVREQAARALGMIESPDAVAALGRALSDIDANVREQAARALGMIESPEGAALLVQALDDAERGVREQAARALGMIESADAVTGLATALRQDADPNVREQAARALGMIEDEAGLEALIDAVEDENAAVREQALRSISMIIG